MVASTILKQLAEFNFDAAKKKFTELSQQYPDNIMVKIHCFQLAKLFQNTKCINRLAFEIFDQATHHSESLPMVHELYCEYHTLEDAAPLPYSLDVKLLLSFIHLKQLDTSKKLIKHLMNTPKKDVMLVKALNTLARALEQNGESDDAYRYQAMANDLQKSL